MSKAKPRSYVTIGNVLHFVGYGLVYGLGFFFPIAMTVAFIYSLLAASVHAIKFMINQARLSKLHQHALEDFKTYFDAKENRTVAAHNFILQSFLLSFLYFTLVGVPLFQSPFGYFGLYALDYALLTVFKTNSVNEVRAQRAAQLSEIDVPHSAYTGILADMLDIDANTLEPTQNHPTYGFSPPFNPGYVPDIAVGQTYAAPHPPPPVNHVPYSPGWWQTPAPNVAPMGTTQPAPPYNPDYYAADGSAYTNTGAPPPTTNYWVPPGF